MFYRKVNQETIIIKIQQCPTGISQYAQWYHKYIGNIYNVDECYVWDDSYYYVVLNKDGEQTNLFIHKRDATIIDRYKKLKKICSKIIKED